MIGIIASTARRYLGPALVLALAAGCAAGGGPKPADIIAAPPRFDEDRLESPWKGESPYYYYLRATFFLKENKTAEAVEALNKAIELKPDASFLYNELAAIYIQQQKENEAAETLKRAMVANPDYLPVLMKLAALESRRQNKQESIRLYRKVIDIEPNNEDAYLFLANLLTETGQEKEMAEILGALTTKIPSSYLGFYYLGKFYFDQKNYDKALDSLQRSIRIRPQFYAALKLLAQIQELLQDMPAAVEAYRKVIGANPHDKESRVRLGDILLKLDREDEALKVLGDNRFESVGRESSMRLGSYYFEKGEWQKSLDQFEEFLKGSPNDTRSLAIIAILRQKLGRDDDALSALDKILVLESANIEALIQKAALVRKKGRTSESLSLLSEAEKLDPSNVDIYIQKAAVYEEDKLFDQALATLNAAMEKIPGNDRLHFYRGVIYDKKEDDDLAEKDMREAVRLNPEHANAYNYLGYMFADKGIRLDESVELIKKALVLEPENGFFLDSLGWAYFRLGKNEDALKELLKALKHVPDDAVVLEHVGDVYIKMKKKDSALEYWRKALFLDPANAALKEKIEKQNGAIKP